MRVSGGQSPPPGCDTFFTIDGMLLDCATATPIAGATVVTTTDPGAWGDETETTTTDSQGRFEAGLDKPRDEAATVTFAKPGFEPLSHDFKGLPSEPFEADFCLQAAPP